MRRIALLLLVAVGLPLAVARAETRTGTVTLPTFTTPTLARLMYTTTSSNGLIGYVFRLSKRTGYFTLRTTGGLTGEEDFDIVFYRAIDGVSGVPAGDALCTDTAPTCTKEIPQNAEWAIVTLSVGFMGSFSYSTT